MFEALQLGPFLLWTRLLFLLLGVWLFTEFFLRLSQSASLSLQHFQDKWFWYVIAFVSCGRLFAVVAEYKAYFRDPLRIFILWDGGFSFFGGAAGIALVLYFATRGQRSIFLHWLDALVPASTLGLVFSWLGSFFAGQAYGRPMDWWWGVTYDAMNVRYSVPIHPVQLYYAFFYFILTFVLLIIRKREKRVGEETLVGIIAAAVGTFIFEFYRGDFSIPVYATKIDFLLLLLLFMSLGLFLIIERRLTERGFLFYEIALGVTVTGYLFARRYLDIAPYELRLSQLLSVLALLAVIVYVVLERRRYPYL